MLNLYESIYLVVFIIELILGLGSNSIIGLLNYINWVKSKRMSLSDFIITSIALSRICFLSLIIADFIRLFNPNIYKETRVYEFINLLWLFLNYLTIWLTTCLSVFYCLKIANFSHSLFLWLKWRVSYVVIWNMLGSLLFALLSTTSMIKELIVAFSSRQTKLIANYTESISNKSNYPFGFLFSILWMVIPFIVTLCSSLLMVLSLKRHVQQMKNHVIGSRDPSSEAHLRATRRIVSFLILYIVNLVALFILSFSNLFPNWNTAFMCGEIITAAYPSIHSLLLLWGNNKLKQAFLKLLQRRFEKWN